MGVEAGQPARRRRLLPTRRDLLLVFGLSIVAFALAQWLDAFEHYVRWTRGYERYGLDELLIAATISCVALTVVAYRRARDADWQRQHRLRVERTLEETGQRYQSLFDYHPDAVLSFDLEATITAANASVSTLTGYSFGQLTTLTIPDLVVEEDLASALTAFAGVLDRRPQQLEARINRRDGRRVPLSLTGLPMVVDDEVVGVYVIAQDISRRVLMENELRRARQVAEHANAAKSVFLANVSHEIRTPLTTVLGYGELLGETDLDSVQHRFLTTMHSSGVRLLRLVDDLLDFGRIEAGETELEFSTFELGTLVGHTLTPHGEDARAKGLDLRWMLDPDLPARVVGDPDRIAQVLTNLVGNAVKFTDTGWVRVRVRAGDDRGTVQLTVRDSGIGISAEHQDTLFQSFTQADGTTTRRYGGTGLGLAISSELVALMGGTLSVRSQPGIGSTFSVRLPLGAAPTPTAPHQEEPRPLRMVPR
ncbi:PAS domain-containing sensor histidine kinase [Nocardioides ferulae]|uniref:PAS domain-containing sensor histidine kinase n=1 Tax=Nocardioides ferulae TaxID=2340821 RepID=UPI000EAF65D9|nr:ATP-binding protein [Nocardioides ferulae]